MLLPAFTDEFARYRSLSERAAAQLSFEQLREPLDAQTNSVAIIMKHLAGNLRSRWTDALTTDGEKPWRNRDQEFVDTYKSRDEVMDDWQSGWSALEASLRTFSEADLSRTLLIRNEPHTLALALTRSVTHAAYHSGQIVQVSRILVSRSGGTWKTLTIARGESAALNAKMFGSGGAR